MAGGFLILLICLASALNIWFTLSKAAKPSGTVEHSYDVSRETCRFLLDDLPEMPEEYDFGEFIAAAAKLTRVSTKFQDNFYPFSLWQRTLWQTGNTISVFVDSVNDNGPDNLLDLYDQVRSQINICRDHLRQCDIAGATGAVWTLKEAMDEWTMAQDRHIDLTNAYLL